MDYKITWDIELSAKNTLEAAREALKIQRDPQSTATVFEVQSEDGKIHEIVDVRETADKQVKRLVKALEDLLCFSAGTSEVCEMCGGDGKSLEFHKHCACYRPRRALEPFKK